MTDNNIIHYRGEQFKLEDYTIQDDDGNAIDLTDSSVEDVHLVVSTSLSRWGAVQFSKTGTDLDANGNVDIEIDPADTENLTPGNYLYEIYVEYSGKQNYVAEVGKYFVKPRVDR